MDESKIRTPARSRQVPGHLFPGTNEITRSRPHHFCGVPAQFSQNLARSLVRHWHTQHGGTGYHHIEHCHMEHHYTGFLLPEMPLSWPFCPLPLQTYSSILQVLLYSYDKQQAEHSTHHKFSAHNARLRQHCLREGHDVHAPP